MIKDFLEKIDEYKTDKKEHLTVIVQKEDEVTYGFDKDCNFEYCNEHNIPYYDRKGAGGTIVHAKGSISIYYVYSHDRFIQFLSCDFIKDLHMYLVNKGINAVIDGNDILIDSCKVASCAENNIPPDFKWCNVGMQISMTQNLELIRNICKKEMIKTPKALSDYGVTLEEMKVFIVDWFKKYGIYTEIEE